MDATLQAVARNERGSPAKSVILGAGIGNALEWYDFASFVLFSRYFSTQFFHAEDPTAAFLSTLAVFAVGFLLRPIGGVYFGWLSDRRGRRSAMVTSMAVTAAGCLVIAVSPTYASIGLMAPVLLVFGRLLQGFGLGGEIGASFTFLVESAPVHRRGLWSSSMFIAITGGSLLATAVGLVLTQVFSTEEMTRYGWRIPFFFGTALGVYALFLRGRLKETSAFEQEQSEARTSVSPQPMARAIWEHRASVLRIIALTAGPTLTFNTWMSGAITFATHFKGVDARDGLLALCIGCLVYMAIQPVWGALSDRIGRKPNLLMGAGGSALVIVPLLMIIDASFVRLTLAICLGLAVLAAWTAIAPAVYAELFPTRIRASGVAIPYSLTVAIFGGTAPYLQNWLADHGHLGWFAAYLIALNLLTVLAVIWMPETRGRALE
ncbi:MULTISPECIES: MFS transporter [Pandoraea]|uniref:Alpha-ketoglutarate permease n=1 Tax=Pandoraea communis TaxID=2508297 RepID=A0A5E4RSJ4_9BURK|nr:MULTISPECIES: MFS transporter [Pandoraea]EON14636.1 general substrate transporter [Pandoraea sp. SD6-2]MDM8358394.1 MFS transporter [Pandoraea communis]VVD65404.1 Alpha-ketoglutarate permease [Pandoraea communis]